MIGEMNLALLSALSMQPFNSKLLISVSKKINFFSGKLSI